MSRDKQLIIRLNDEEAHFLEHITKFGYSKSEWVRKQIREGMKKHPDYLRKKREYHVARAEEIDKELQDLAVCLDENMGSLEEIKKAFEEYNRHEHTNARNIDWIKARYGEELKKMLMAPEEVLEYCQNGATITVVPTG